MNGVLCAVLRCLPGSPRRILVNASGGIRRSRRASSRWA